jgi:hypothetical protein
MTRRVLASRIAEGRPAISYSAAPATHSRPVIRTGHIFPAVAGVQPRVVHLTRRDVQRACRARFGNLSGQLTI